MSVSDSIHTDSFKDLKRKSLTGIGSLLQRQILVYSFSFIGNIILARILVPDIFGIYAIVAFVVQFFSTFSDVGIGAAVIQRKESLGKRELSTLFWLQQVMALVVVTLAYVAAPLVLNIYSSLPPVSVWLIRGMALSFLLASLKTIPIVQLEKELDFGKIAWVDIGEAVTFQITAITLALLNFGVWSFILAAILQGLVGVSIIYFLSPWRPAFFFHFDSIRSLLHFGLPFQGNQILNFIKDAVTPLFVGAYAGAAAVGYINWARNLAFAPLMLSQVFARVAFPAFSKMQNDPTLLKETIESSTRMLTLILFPITFILMALGPEITHVIFTDKWQPALPAFYLFSCTPLLMGITLPMVSAIMSLGNARILLTMTIVLIAIEWGMGVPFILTFGFSGIALTQPVSYVLFVFIYAHILKSHGIAVSILGNIGSSLTAAVLCGIGVTAGKRLFPVTIISLIILVLFGFILFTAIVYGTNKKLLLELKGYVRGAASDQIESIESAFSDLVTRIKILCDPELRTVKRLIEGAGSRSDQEGALMRTDNDTFVRRLRMNPGALKMEFWKTHFELQALNDYPELTGRLLDFGCGSGHMDVLLAKEGRSVMGIDLSPTAISIANYLKQKENIAVQNRLSFALADVTQDSPQGDQLCDSAWASHVFEHIADPSLLFQGLRRWLKSGAYLLVSVPFGEAYDDPDHVNHFYNAEDLRLYLKRHVTVIKIEVSDKHRVIRALCRFP